MITPRNVRRALLRACPVSLVALIGALILGFPFAEAVALALFGAAPAAMLWVELWAQTWSNPTTTRNQIKLVLVGWAVGFAVTLVLLLQAVHAQAELAGRDPLTALARLSRPTDAWVLPWLCAFVALSLSATTCLLVNLQHRSTSTLASRRDPNQGSLAGVAVVGGGWILLLVAPLLAAGPGALSWEERFGFLLLFGVSSAVALGVATPVIATLCVLADALEEWLWPKRP